MLALAGIPLGLRFRFLDPDPKCPAAEVGELIVGAYDDEASLRKLARGVEVVTVEFENVPARAAEYLQSHAMFYPGRAALAAAQERLAEKSLFHALDIPVPRFAAVESRAGLQKAAAYCGVPSVLKTRRLGYDGKGQFVIKSMEMVDEAWDVLGGVPLILEEFVTYEREVSLIAVRGRGGETVFYPLIENHHRLGILRLSVAPAPRMTAELQALAEEYAKRLLDRLEYTGVLTIEFFQKGSELVANEMACRVHNSGHWTIEGASCSQFENHLRAILGMPLGVTGIDGFSAMVNIIGEAPDEDAILAIPGARLHWYGKEPRPFRKLGHVNVSAREAWVRDELAAQLRALLGP